MEQILWPYGSGLSKNLNGLSENSKSGLCIYTNAPCYGELLSELIIWSSPTKCKVVARAVLVAIPGPVTPAVLPQLTAPFPLSCRGKENNFGFQEAEKPPFTLQVSWKGANGGGGMLKTEKSFRRSRTWTTHAYLLQLPMHVIHPNPPSGWGATTCRSRE